MATFILLHGSFHAAWNWHRVTPLLERMGHRTLPLDLPAHGLDATPARCVTLAGCVDRTLDAARAVDGDVVLVAHSRNGIVISQAAERDPGAIFGLVYVAAYLVPDGKTMVDYALMDRGSLVVQNVVPRLRERRARRLLRVARHPAARWLLARALPARLQTHALAPAAIREALYHDCPDEITALAHALLEPEPNWPGFTPLAVSADRFGRVPKVYVECTEDRAVTPSLQRRMLHESPCDRVVSLESGHSPFFSMPSALADVLVQSLETFGAAGGRRSETSRVARRGGA